MKKRIYLKSGYQAQNGYVFTKWDCKNYNRIQKEINCFRTAGMPLRDGIENHSHIMFKMITGM